MNSRRHHDAQTAPNCPNGAVVAALLTALIALHHCTIPHLGSLPAPFPVLCALVSTALERTLLLNLQQAQHLRSNTSRHACAKGAVGFKQTIISVKTKTPIPYRYPYRLRNPRMSMSSFFCFFYCCWIQGFVQGLRGGPKKPAPSLHPRSVIRAAKHSGLERWSVDSERKRNFFPLSE